MKRVLRHSFAVLLRGLLAFQPVLAQAYPVSDNGFISLSTLSGGRGDIFLVAGNDINLTAAQATSENVNKSVSGGVAINLDLSGASFNYAQSKGNGSTLSHVNTHVIGSGNVHLQSGRDTNLGGAVVSGESVTGDIGGNLVIESLLDTVSAEAKGVSAGGGFSSSGFGLHRAYKDAEGDAAIIPEQSGIFAGTGGFDIKVGGKTSLKCGVIYAGAALIHPRIFEGAAVVLHSLNIYFDRAIDNGRLFGWLMAGCWITVGTPDAIAAAEKSRS